MQKRNVSSFHPEDSGITKKYLGLPETKSVGKINLELLRDFRDLESCFYKYKRLIGSLMFIMINHETYNDVESELRVSLNTLKVTRNSICKQGALILSICSKLKCTKIPDTKTLEVLKRTHTNSLNRLQYIKDTVIAEVIKITPLYDYSLYLESIGVNLIDDIDNHVSEGDKTEDEKLREYSTFVNNWCVKNNSNLYQKEFEAYVARLKQVEVVRESYKKRERIERLKRKSEMNSYKINAEAKRLEIQISKGYSAGAITSRVNCIRGNAWVLIVAPVSGNRTGTPKYVVDVECNVSNRTGDAKIFTDEEELNKAVEAFKIKEPYAEYRIVNYCK